MRLPVRLYALLTIITATVMMLADLTTALDWPHAWTPFSALILLTLYVTAVHFLFTVHSGWITDASTVPAVATALLLPPGIVMLIAGLSLVIYAVSRRRLGLKGLFNAASAMLAVGSAAHVATFLGGPTELTNGSGWTALAAAVLASMAYYLVSATTVAGAVAIEQRRSLWAVLRGKIGVKALVEFALGLLGSTLAVVLMAAPGLAPALVLPGVLVYLDKQKMDRGARGARHAQARWHRPHPARCDAHVHWPSCGRCRPAGPAQGASRRAG